MQSKYSSIGRFFFLSLTSKLAAFSKVSFVLGSQVATLSLVNCVAPMSGALLNLPSMGLFFLVPFLIRLFFFGSFSFHILEFYVPGLCAALYWRCSSAWYRVGLPAACMVLFAVHPVGGASFAYALYWLIPITLYFSPRKTLFSHALSSTFTAHAVGSVIWLYTVGMTPAAWLSLIPLVAVERLCFALGMVAVYRGYLLIESALACSQMSLFRPFAR